MTTPVDHHHVLDIDSISSSIENELKTLHCLSNESCIFRVPNVLRCLDEMAYTPEVVSIGPFHHGKPELKQMEVNKRRYLQDFLQLSTATTVKDFVNIVKHKETELRYCYEETIEVDSEDFVKMVLIDAAFVITVLVKFSCPSFRSRNDRLIGRPRSRNDSLIGRPWMEDDVRYDMLLLENQLPFFILNDLYSLCDIPNRVEEGHSVIKLAHAFFKDKWGLWVTTEVVENQDLSIQVVHLLDFLRLCQKPSKWEVQDAGRRATSLYAPTATELQQAGVKFELSPSSKKLDIEFKNGILKIPVLRITRKGEFFLRNLQAFEQRYCRDKYINNYIALMTMLVKTPKDVEIFGKSRILENRSMNNDTLSTLFHNLALGNCVSRKSFHFSGLIEELNKYCGSLGTNGRLTKLF